MIEYDYAIERVARIDLLVAEATHTKAPIERPTPALAHQLIVTLDAVLKELGGVLVVDSGWSELGRIRRPRGD